MRANEPTAIANARLVGRDGLWSIEIAEGRIGKVAKYSGAIDGALDAGGRLVSESFAIAHIHLDKVHTARLAPLGALSSYETARMDTRESIRLASEVKKHYRKDEIVARARTAVEEAVGFGCTRMRAFADTDTKARLEAVRALMELRREYRERIDVQVVAFPQEGIEADPGAAEYVETAMEEGADVVGGIPWIEDGTRAQQQHVDKMFDLAVKFRKPVAMLVDDTGDPTMRTLAMLAKRTLKEKWSGNVQACHARAMSVYPLAYARKVARMCAEAGVGVVSDPHTGSFHTRIDLFKEEGVAVALGQDDCADAYYPFGRCNMLEIAFLASHLLRRMLPRDLEELMAMVTSVPAAIIGRRDIGLRRGCMADLIVLDGFDCAQVLARHSKPLFVLKGGRVVSEG